MFSKIIPLDIKITPTMLKRWFEGDGNYYKIKNKKSTHLKGAQLSIAVCSFLRNHVDLLIEKFKEIGIEFNYSKQTRVIRITKKAEVKKFFDFMGHCEVPCYVYKWCTKEELAYQTTYIDWDKIDFDEVDALHMYGLSWEQIGKEYGIPGSTMAHKANSLGYDTSFLVDYEKKYNVDWDNVMELRKSGVIWDKIGHMYGVSGIMLARTAKSLGYDTNTFRYRKEKYNVDWDEAKKLLKEGESYTSISKHFGVPKSWFRKMIKGHFEKTIPLDSLEKPPLCGCGCGESTTWNSHKLLWNTYKYRHPYKNKDKFATSREILPFQTLCICGCGKLTTPGSFYIKGHRQKGNLQIKPVV